MTLFRLCNRDALVLLTFLVGWSVATAWVTPPINNACSITTSRPSTTRLAMFDWFNPKPKTSTKEEKKSDDWLSNMFNLGSPPDKAAEEKTKAALEKTRPKDEEVKAVVTPVDVKTKTDPTVVASTESPAKEDAKPATPEAAEQEVHSGVVNWFNRLKGYGFINASDGSTEADVFVHQSEIQAEGYRYLLDGEHVEYIMVHDKNGRPQAHHVTGPNGGDVTVLRKAKKDEANNN